jgi:hypothetical protein
VDSRRVSRAPRYLGATGKRIAISDTGLSPSLAGLSRPFSYRFPILRLTRTLLIHASSAARNLRSLTVAALLRVTCSDEQVPDYCGPATPRSPFGIARFRLFRFRSPLLSESRLFSLPLGTEMVHFPRFAPYAYVFSVW